MRIKKCADKGMLILPDTERERKYINKTFGRGSLVAYVKCGLTPKDVIGIRIVGEKGVLKSDGINDDPDL